MLRRTSVRKPEVYHHRRAFDLERPLLTETKNYYTRKSQAWLETDSTPAYMVKAERALADPCVDFKKAKEAADAAAEEAVAKAKAAEPEVPGGSSS